ncbi:MAG: acyltransferase family protein [Janthinobacterium lividum]
MLPQPTPPTALPYQPELMGLRAVAVGLVVLAHWTLADFPIGEVGRLPLFVLSGYLISGIIWKNNIYWGGAEGWPRRLGIFYTRRFLRIIPPYYAALALGALLPLVTLHEYPGWFLLPLSNMLCFRLQHWPEGVGHYWSMAVEEQFYLLWPLLLGLIKRRAGWLWLLVGASVGYRAYGALYLVPQEPVFATVLLPASLDLFALGALLRLHTAAARAQLQQAAAWPAWPAALTWVGWALVWVFTRGSLRGEQVWITIYPTLGALAGYFTLRWLMCSPPQTRWLAHPWAQWLGQRSYGLYLYHLMLPVFYQRLVYHFLPTPSPVRQWWLGPWPTVVVLSPLVILLCAVSWHWLEAPLEKLKTRFRYNAPASVPVPVSD